MHNKSETTNSNMNIWGYLTLLLPVSLGMVVVFDSWRYFIAIGLLFGGGWLWKQYQQREQKQLEHLHQVFYQLIKKNKGRITTLDFAMTAQVSGEIAQEYLDQRAKEFVPHFEVTEQGGIIYYFESIYTITNNDYPVLEQKNEAKPKPEDLPDIMVSKLEQLEIVKPVYISEKSTNSLTQKTAIQLPKLTPIVVAKPETKKSPELFPLDKKNEGERVDLSLNQTELGKRLNVHPTTVSKWKLKPEFGDWSREQDPDAIAWVYSPESKRFYPLE